MTRNGQWALQDAEARFSEVVRKAKTEGPQHITVHGREEVVVVSTDEYRPIELLKDVARRIELNDWLEHQLRPMFEHRVLEICARPELIIAATALHHGLTIVSRDTEEYALANVRTLNPWISPFHAS